MTDKSPEQYLHGIRLFNRGDYFECHDVLEELWTETFDERRNFYQGLIQAAVALHHFEGGNLAGAMRMYHSARAYLQGYPPRYEGIDLAGFLRDFETCFRELREADKSEYPFHITLRTDRIPRIAFCEDTGE